MLIPAKHVCDFCGAEDPRFKGVFVPVISDCEWTEGRATEPSVEFAKYDICERCLLLATNIRAGFQGSNPRIVKESKNDN